MKLPRSKMGLPFSLVYLGIVLLFLPIAGSDFGGGILLLITMPWGGILFSLYPAISDKLNESSAVFIGTILAGAAINTSLLYLVVVFISKAFRKRETQSIPLERP